MVERNPNAPRRGRPRLNREVKNEVINKTNTNNTNKSSLDDNIDVDYFGNNENDSLNEDVNVDLELNENDVDTK